MAGNLNGHMGAANGGIAVMVDSVIGRITLIVSVSLSMLIRIISPERTPCFVNATPTSSCSIVGSLSIVGTPGAVKLCP